MIILTQSLQTPVLDVQKKKTQILKTGTIYVVVYLNNVGQKSTKRQRNK